jgi:hypothetical protein
VNKRQRLRVRLTESGRGSPGIFKGRFAAAQATGVHHHDDPSISLSFKFFRSAGGSPVTVTQVRTGPAVRPGGASPGTEFVCSLAPQPARGQPGPGSSRPTQAASRLTLSGQSRWLQEHRARLSTLSRARSYRAVGLRLAGQGFSKRVQQKLNHWRPPDENIPWGAGGVDRTIDQDSSRSLHQGGSGWLCGIH